MTTGNKPIEVFVRHCYHSPNTELPNRKRPEWFDKYLAFHNLSKTILSKLANVTVIYDNYFGENKIIHSNNWDTINITCGSEAKSFLSTLDIVLSKNIPDDTIIYFLEDDYLHRYNWCNALIEGFNLPAKYVTLYDHLDKYLDYPDLQSKIYSTPLCHWRTTPSTTNTFACKMGQLKQDIEIHRKYSMDREISDDNAKFIELGGCISSIPGYSTHCNDYLSPGIDWANVGRY